MKKRYWLFVYSLLISQAWASSTIIISTSDWPPFISKNAPQQGYISQVITEAFAKSDIKVKFVYVPWARAYEKAKVGDFDATSYWYDDPKHKEHFYLSEPLTSEKTMFFRLKSDSPTTWQSLEEFKSVSMSITRGYTYTDSLWQYARANKNSVSIVGSDVQNFKMLLLGRIDVTPVQEIVGWHLLHTLFAQEQVDRIEVMQPPLLVTTGHLFFPKAKPNSVELREKFDKGLSILEANGRLYELKEKLVEGYYSK